MENLEQFEDVRPASAKPRKKLNTLWIFLALLVIFALIYAFVWVSNAKKSKAEALEVLDRAARAEELENAVSEEVIRCEGFIAGEQGEFGEFEYCKRFLEWSEGL
jgi:uncharacterized membrane protein